MKKLFKLVTFYDVSVQLKNLHYDTINFLYNALKTPAITFRLNELLHFNIYNANMQIKSQKAENL